MRCSIEVSEGLEIGLLEDGAQDEMEGKHTDNNQFSTGFEDEKKVASLLICHRLV